MNTLIKAILIIAGLGLLIYGGNELVRPETSVDIGFAEFESQDNTNAYISIGVGIAILIAGVFVKKR